MGDFINLKFQEGAVPVNGVNGCTIEDVIDVLIDRLKGFQDGILRCRENSLTLTKLEEAQMWLERRTVNRIEQGVEGSMDPHK